jgi:hypothetical protein
MKIYFASLGNDTYPFSNKVRQKNLTILFSYYDLSSQCPIPFRKESFKKIIKEKQNESK